MEGLTGAQRMRGEPGQFLGLMVWVFPNGGEARLGIQID